MSNRIKPFKNRKIDLSKPVLVYRNLNCKGVSYSVKQGNLVVAHTDCLTLQNIEFRVSEKGKARVKREKRKNVHAFIKGYVVKRVMDYTASEMDKMPNCPYTKITYNPYLDLGFHYKWADRSIEVKTCTAAYITTQGVFIGGFLFRKSS